MLGTGIGRPSNGLSGLRDAHQQAQRALSVGQEIHGAAAVTHFDQRGVFRLLSLIPDREAGRYFSLMLLSARVAAVVGPVLSTRKLKSMALSGGWPNWWRAIFFVSDKRQ